MCEKNAFWVENQFCLNVQWRWFWILRRPFLLFLKVENSVLKNSFPLVDTRKGLRITYGGKCPSLVPKSKSVKFTRKESIYTDYQW